jgi:hypothetical protein
MTAESKILEIYRSPIFQMGMDACRIILIAITILIIIKLTSEIEAVKMLNYDPCRLCENKTGAVCIYSSVQKEKIPILTSEELEILLNGT